MRITKVELKNFKRFTDLTIDGIPADTRLALLIGSNGSGKSSVFDAFEYTNKLYQPRHKGQISANLQLQIRNDYSNLSQKLKAKFRKFSAQGDTDVKITATLPARYEDGSDLDDMRYNSFTGQSTGETFIPLYYGRTSFRHIASLSEIKPFSGDIKWDDNRPGSFAERDERFGDDIGFVTRQIVTAIFRENFSSGEIQTRYIQPINEALSRVFGGESATRISFLEIIPPGDGKPAKLTFRKGSSEIGYDDLSAGEKEVFNIIFNLFTRSGQYTDTVYFFDELDLHLNTQLQFNLLKEITENWLPENCQLWTASHSLGFIDYARQYPQGVIIDFDDLDFDQHQTLFPQPNEQLDVYDIAVPKEMLFKIMRGKKLVLCENQNDEFYNLLALPDTLFVGMKDARSLFLQVKNDNRYYSLRDRDFLSDTEIERLEREYPHHHILRYYDFENYLYHPDNIAELQLNGFDRETYIAEIIRQKNERFDAILLNLKATRQSYEELKTGEIADKEPDAIVADLKSDDFIRYYKYFDMKTGFNRAYLMPFNLDKKRLVQTRWFRSQIEAVLNR